MSKLELKVNGKFFSRDGHEVLITDYKYNDKSEIEYLCVTSKYNKLHLYWVDEEGKLLTEKGLDLVGPYEEPKSKVVCGIVHLLDE